MQTFPLLVLATVIQFFVETQQQQQQQQNPKIRNKRRLWHQKVIPYHIHQYVHNRTLIEETVSYFNTLSCVQWKHKDENDEHFVSFEPGSACVSFIGQTTPSRSQPVFVAPHCSSRPIILHEMMHVMGFYHEMRRFDHDKYVEIFWENIVPGFEKYFVKLPKHETDFWNEEYDVTSVMHYGSYAYSRFKSRKTIALQGGMEIPERSDLSVRDIGKINELYHCEDIEEGLTSWSTFQACDDNCKKYRSRFCYSPSGRHPCINSTYYGVVIDEQQCTREECSRDGWWSRWTRWSPCDVFCGAGEQIRRRECNDPPPRFDGNQCDGQSEGKRACKMGSCFKTRYDCEFDNDGSCEWKMDGRWEIHSSSMDNRIFPSSDVSYGNGNYILLTGNAQGEISMSLLQVQTRCLQFYYQISAQAMLSIILTAKSGNTTQYMVRGQLNNVWEIAMLQLKSYHYTEITFSAITKDIDEFVAIDDIFFSNPNCETSTKGNILKSKDSQQQPQSSSFTYKGIVVSPTPSVLQSTDYSSTNIKQTFSPATITILPVMNYSTTNINQTSLPTRSTIYPTSSIKGETESKQSKQINKSSSKVSLQITRLFVRASTTRPNKTIYLTHNTRPIEEIPPTFNEKQYSGSYKNQASKSINITSKMVLLQLSMFSCFLLTRNLNT